MNSFVVALASVVLGISSVLELSKSSFDGVFEMRSVESMIAGVIPFSTRNESVDDRPCHTAQQPLLVPRDTPLVCFIGTRHSTKTHLMNLFLGTRIPNRHADLGFVVGNGLAAIDLPILPPEPIARVVNDAPWHSADPKASLAFDGFIKAVAGFSFCTPVIVVPEINWNLMSFINDAIDEIMISRLELSRHMKGERSDGDDDKHEPIMDKTTIVIAVTSWWIVEPISLLQQMDTFDTINEAMCSTGKSFGTGYAAGGAEVEDSGAQCGDAKNDQHDAVSRAHQIFEGTFRTGRFPIRLEVFFMNGDRGDPVLLPRNRNETQHHKKAMLAAMMRSHLSLPSIPFAATRQAQWYNREHGDFFSPELRIVQAMEHALGRVAFVTDSDGSSFRLARHCIGIDSRTKIRSRDDLHLPDPKEPQPTYFPQHSYQIAIPHTSTGVTLPDARLHYRIFTKVSDKGADYRLVQIRGSGCRLEDLQIVLAGAGNSSMAVLCTVRQGGVIVRRFKPLHLDFFLGSGLVVCLQETRNDDDDSRLVFVFRRNCHLTDLQLLTAEVHPGGELSEASIYRYTRARRVLKLRPVPSYLSQLYVKVVHHPLLQAVLAPSGILVLPVVGGPLKNQLVSEIKFVLLLIATYGSWLCMKLQRCHHSDAATKKNETQQPTKKTQKKEKSGEDCGFPVTLCFYVVLAACCHFIDFRGQLALAG